MSGRKRAVQDDGRAFSQKSKAICNFAMQATAIFVMIVVVVVVLISTVMANVNQPSMFRMCGSARATDVDGGVGEVGAVTEWTVTADLNADMITYDLRVLATMSAVRAIEIRGPLQLGIHSGPLAAVLCGQASITTTTPTLPSCNNMELPGKVSGLVRRVFNGSVAEGFAVRDFIQAVRDNPSLYYGEVMTDDRPTTPGAIRFSLASYCGNP